MEEGKLPVRWGWLGEVEEEENSVGTLTVPTASELFSLEAEKTRKEKEEGRRREKRRRRINKSSTDVLRERRRGGGRRGEGVSSSGQQILLPQDFTNVTLVLEDCKGSQAPCSAPSR